MGILVLQVIPPLVVYSSVPPLPVTVPMAILPPDNTHPVQVLLTIANEPAGADGVVQDPGTVTTADEEVLKVAGLASQVHLVTMDCIGPV